MNEMAKWKLIQPFYAPHLLKWWPKQLNPYHLQKKKCSKNVSSLSKSVPGIAARNFEETLNILMCCIIWFRVKTVKAGWEIKSQISDFAQEWRRQWGNWENFWTKENNIQRCTRSDSKGSGPFSMKLEIPCFYLGT